MMFSTVQSKTVPTKRGMKDERTTGEWLMEEDGSAPFTIHHSLFTTFTSSLILHP
jgi:hypothetical protein